VYVCVGNNLGNAGQLQPASCSVQTGSIYAYVCVSRGGHLQPLSSEILRKLPMTTDSRTYHKFDAYSACSTAGALNTDQVPKLWLDRGYKHSSVLCRACHLMKHCYSLQLVAAALHRPSCQFVLRQLALPIHHNTDPSCDSTAVWSFCSSYAAGTPVHSPADKLSQLPQHHSATAAFQADPMTHV
jgi:hypothetical protein